MNDKKRLEFFLYNVQELFKLEKFQKALDRNDFFTSSYTLNMTVEEHEKGYYYIGEGTQTRVSQFVSCLGENIRKPRNSKSIKTHCLGEISFDGSSIHCHQSVFNEIAKKIG